MHHFVLTNWVDLGPYFTINKAVVRMVLAAGIVILLFAYVTNNLRLVPGRWQSALEVFVAYVRDDMCVATIGHGGEKFLPFILSLFTFVFCCNFLGIVPIVGFTATSNINVTATLAIVVFAVGVVLAVRHRGPLGFFTGLVPGGVPKLLWPLMFAVEMVSLFAKHFALAVRLFANMFAGHIVLFVFAGMSATLAGSLITWILVPLPFAMTAVMTAFEMFVALIQAFIFAILAALYIGEAVHAH